MTSAQVLPSEISEILDWTVAFAGHSRSILQSSGENQEAFRWPNLNRSKEPTPSVTGF